MSVKTEQASDVHYCLWPRSCGAVVLLRLARDRRRLTRHGGQALLRLQRKRQRSPRPANLQATRPVATAIAADLENAGKLL